MKDTTQPPRQAKSYDWQKVAWLTKDFSTYKKIYLSSLEDSNLFGFYKCFNGRLQLTLLSPDSLETALNEKYSLLIYSKDIFPPCNKISVHELWNKLSERKRDNLVKFCYINEKPSIIKEENLTAHSLIQKFDEGAFSVAITDCAGNFIGTVTQSEFRKTFPRKQFYICPELFLNATQDEATIKLLMAKIFLTDETRELPIIQDKKILSSCKIGKSPLLNNREENFPPVYWDAISDEVAKDFLEGNRRILISSTFGTLKGFCERFKNLADVSVYNEPTEKFLNEDFDFLIYGADVWENFPFIKFSARKLYDNLLAEEIRRYLTTHGVEYFYLEAPESFQAKNKFRTKYSKRMSSALLTFGSPENDYLIHSDKFSQTWNSIGGIRRTVDTPPNFNCQVFLFGACSVVGTFVDDEHTIASLMQAHFNKNLMAYKVVNCGNNGGFPGATTNELYRIADTRFHVGDIVVHVNGDVWGYAFKDNLRDRLSLADAFNITGKKFSLPFRDTKSGHHLNAEGNEMMANYLYRKLQSLNTCEARSTKSVPSFFSVTPIVGRLLKNFQLKKFLTALEKEKVDAETVGALVINCNPFTLGHRYLVEVARQSVDFLYVFVIEEDRSTFTFHDRFLLAKENCSDLDGVKVLSSGKYIISMTTFADYFQKDFLQGIVTSAPVADIKLFGQTIAPLLGITKRFVGDEPLDSLTKRYNQAMHHLLPDFGVELVEIPRITTKDGEIISASTVRNLIKQGNLDACKKFLPAITWKFIIEKF